MLDCEITHIFKNRVTPFPSTKPPSSTASGLFPAITSTSLQVYCLPIYEAPSLYFKNLQRAPVSKNTGFCSPNLVSLGVDTQMNKRQVRGLPQSDSAVGILTGQDTFSSTKRRRRLRDPPSLIFDGHQGSLLDVQRTRRDANRPPPSSAEITNGWSTNSNPLTCFTACTETDLPFT